MNIPLISEHKAAAQAVVSVAGATSWLSTANEVVQLIAGLVAIISGLAAAYHYLWRARKGK